MALGAAVRAGSLSHIGGFPFWKTLHQHCHSHLFPYPSKDLRAAHPMAEPKLLPGWGAASASWVPRSDSNCLLERSCVFIFPFLIITLDGHPCSRPANGPRDTKTYSLLAVTACVSRLPCSSHLVWGNYAQSLFFIDHFYWACWRKKIKLLCSCSYKYYFLF